MRRWEYRIVSLYNAGESMVEKANEHGSQGWELTAIDRQDNWVFKRPLEESADRPSLPRIVTSAEKKRAAANARVHDEIDRGAKSGKPAFRITK